MRRTVWLLLALVVSVTCNVAAYGKSSATENAREKCEEELQALRTAASAAGVETEPRRVPQPEPEPEPEPADLWSQEQSEDRPIRVLRSRVRINSAGTPELTIILKNTTRKTVDGFKFQVRCFNNFNDPVLNRMRRRSDEYSGISSDTIRAGQQRSLGTWSLFDFPTCSKAIVVITDAHFADNTLWEGVSRQEEDPREPN